MLDADEAYYKKEGEPLFSLVFCSRSFVSHSIEADILDSDSSHMLDLSEESKEENIETCKKYFERMAKIELWLEMEIGITGGEEDGVDNSSTLRRCS